MLVSQTKSSCTAAINELKHWMKPEKAILSSDPAIGTVPVCNVVVLKPLEIAPATSSLLVNLLKDYQDNSAIRVIHSWSRSGIRQYTQEKAEASS
ncbi:hypothetical protein RJT34_00739 [Clitoria ternatea]|uniref:Uncharacterized protein n=1 Tax=Clitoria ternatea TaxID=43366 RepID=A0AAN9KHI7_CLITE